MLVGEDQKDVGFSVHRCELSERALALDMRTRRVPTGPAGTASIRVPRCIQHQGRAAMISESRVSPREAAAGATRGRQQRQRRFGRALECSRRLAGTPILAILRTIRVYPPDAAPPAWERMRPALSHCLQALMRPMESARRRSRNRREASKLPVPSRWDDLISASLAGF